MNIIKLIIKIVTFIKVQLNICGNKYNNNKQNLFVLQVYSCVEYLKKKILQILAPNLINCLYYEAMKIHKKFANKFVLQNVSNINMPLGKGGGDVVL